MKAGLNHRQNPLHAEPSAMQRNEPTGDLLGFKDCYGLYFCPLSVEQDVD